MTTIAIVFMVLAGLLIWGGLVVSIALLRRDTRADAADDAVAGDRTGDVPGPGAAGASGAPDDAPR